MDLLAIYLSLTKNRCDEGYATYHISRDVDNRWALLLPSKNQTNAYRKGHIEAASIKANI